MQDSICVTQDGKIIIVEMYDTGEQIVEPFIMNITGRWDVYRIKFVKTKIRADCRAKRTSVPYSADSLRHN